MGIWMLKKVPVPACRWCHKRHGSNKAIIKCFNLHNSTKLEGSKIGKELIQESKVR